MKRLCLAVLPLLILLFACKSSVQSPADETFVIKKVHLRDVVSQSGEVKPIVKVDIKSEASGRIDRIIVKEGQKIHKGDTILIIDPSRLITQKRKLELSLKEAEIEYLKSTREYTDGKELFSNGSQSDKQLFDLQLKHQLDSINLERQKLELVDITDQLNKTVIKSPMSGVVTSLSVEEGEIAVSATSSFQNGTAIATIADISKLEVISTIGEVDFVNIRQGQRVVIRPEAMENVTTNGTVSFIALSAKKDDKNELSGFEVRVAVDSIVPGIAPGINVTLEFTIKEKDNVTGIPYHFVQKDDSGHYAFTMKVDSKGKPEPHRVPLVIGETDFKFYEIISGLNTGDTVVLPASKKSDKVNVDD